MHTHPHIYTHTCVYYHKATYFISFNCCFFLYFEAQTWRLLPSSYIHAFWLWGSSWTSAENHVSVISWCAVIWQQTDFFSTSPAQCKLCWLCCSCVTGVIVGWLLLEHISQSSFKCVSVFTTPVASLPTGSTQSENIPADADSHNKLQSKDFFKKTSMKPAFC